MLCELRCQLQSRLTWVPKFPCHCPLAKCPCNQLSKNPRKRGFHSGGRCKPVLPVRQTDRHHSVSQSVSQPQLSLHFLRLHSSAHDFKSAVAAAAAAAAATKEGKLKSSCPPVRVRPRPSVSQSVHVRQRAARSRSQTPPAKVGRLDGRREWSS